MTVSGLCIFLDIDLTTWVAYRRRQGFTHITGQVDDIIRTQKFEGAAADLLNANIIARELGLVDKAESVVKNDYSDLSDEELDLELMRMFASSDITCQQNTTG